MFKHFNELSRGYQVAIWIVTIIIAVLLPMYLGELTKSTDFYTEGYLDVWVLTLIGFALSWFIVLVILWIIKGFSKE